MKTIKNILLLITMPIWFIPVLLFSLGLAVINIVIHYDPFHTGDV